jgi:hypothetical protein
MCEASGPFLLLHQATSVQLPTFHTLLRCVVIGANQLHFRPSIVPPPKIHVGLPCLKLSSHLLQHSYQLWLQAAIAPLPSDLPRLRFEWVLCSPLDLCHWDLAVSEGLIRICKVPNHQLHVCQRWQGHVIPQRATIPQESLLKPGVSSLNCREFLPSSTMRR